MKDFFLSVCDWAEIWSLLNELTYCSFNHGAHTKHLKNQISAPGLDLVIKTEWAMEHIDKLICM